jgi:hypothetical protein
VNGGGAEGEVRRSLSLHSTQGVLSFLRCGRPTIEPYKEEHREREQYPNRRAPKNRPIHVQNGSWEY